MLPSVAAAVVVPAIGRDPLGSQRIKRLSFCRYAFDSETLLLLSLVVSFNSSDLG